MDFSETPDQAGLRTSIRQYLRDLITPEVRGQLMREDEGSPLYLSLIKQMGQAGWLGLGWPREYGGRGFGPVEQLIVVDEIKRAGAPLNFVTIGTVGPALIAAGTDEQRQRFLPPILRGELHVAIGYTETGAGTDLASLRTRAVRDGDSYIVNGAKAYTARAQFAQYIWLACRTDTEAPKHQGISILMVPTTSPGFSWSPVRTVGGMLTTMTTYEDVRVHCSLLIGEENQGWRLITAQLNQERVGHAAFAGLADRLFEDTVEWCRRPGRNGRRLIDEHWVQSDLARVKAKLAALRLVNQRMASIMAAGQLPPAEAAAAKVFGTETVVDVYRRLLGVLGPLSYLPAGSAGAVLHGELERAARESQTMTFGGGTNDIQRQLIAWHGLGMKRDRGTR